MTSVAGSGAIRRAGPRRFARALFTLALLTGARAGAAETEYAVLFRVLEPGRGIENFDRLRAVQRIESKIAGVAPAQIRITVRANAGDIAVPVALDGAMQFPLSDALLAENPVVATNQPRGSLTLTLSIELSLPHDTRIPAADIRAALEQVDAMFAARGAAAPPRVRGAEFHFSDHFNGGLTVRGTSERLLMPDAEGRVVLMRDSDLAADAREIELAAIPTHVLPFFGQ